MLDGAYTYSEGSVNVSIFVTVDAKPIPQATLTRNDSRRINFTKVLVTTTAIQLLGPLSRHDSGIYILRIANAAGVLMETFRISVPSCQCKLMAC